MDDRNHDPTPDLPRERGAATAAPRPPSRLPLLAVAVAGVILVPSVADLRWPPSEAHETDGRRPSRREVRAVWVTRWDIRSAHDVRATVSNCAALGLTRIYFQVRGQADALYRSSLEPWCEELGGEPDFDPLGVAVAEAHRVGLEVYAWVNVLPGWKGRRPPRSKSHLVHTHPEWFLEDRRGRRSILDAEHYALLNPCLPAVREHIVGVVREIASGYAVDGVQLDYLRFLTRDIEAGEDVPYDSSTLAVFRRRTGGFPIRHPREWDAFRRESIDTLVRDIAATVGEARPDAAVSLAAIKDLNHARSHLFQDAPRWWRRAWIDEVCPMLYTTRSASFENLLRAFAGEMPARNLIPGIGIYVAKDAVAGRQIEIARRWKTGGYALFAYSSLFLSRSPHSSTAPAAAERRARMRKRVRAENGVTAGAR